MTTELPRNVKLARQLHADMSVASVTRVIDALDQIGEYSTSYPFLALSRRIGAAYGDVLWYADFLEGNARMSDARVRGALERLSERQKTWIMGRVDNLTVERERAEHDLEKTRTFTKRYGPEDDR